MTRQRKTKKDDKKQIAPTEEGMSEVDAKLAQISSARGEGKIIKGNE